VFSLLKDQVCMKNNHDKAKEEKTRLHLEIRIGIVRLIGIN